MASRDCDKNAKFVTQRPLMGAIPHLAAVKFLVLSLFHARCSKIQKIPNLNSQTKLFQEISSKVSSRKFDSYLKKNSSWRSNNDSTNYSRIKNFEFLFLIYFWVGKFCLQRISFKFLQFRNFLYKNNNAK